MSVIEGRVSSKVGAMNELAHVFVAFHGLGRFPWVAGTSYLGCKWIPTCYFKLALHTSCPWDERKIPLLLCVNLNYHGLIPEKFGAGASSVASRCLPDVYGVEAMRQHPYRYKITTGRWGGVRFQSL